MKAKQLHGLFQARRVLCNMVQAGVLVAVLSVLPLASAYAVEGGQDAQPSSSSSSAGAPAADGWNEDRTSYFVNGKPATGPLQIDGVWHAFNQDGTLMEEAFALNGVTYYPSDKGILRARKVSGVWRYADGQRMTPGDVKEMECLLYAEKVAEQITDPQDTLEEKRLKCYEYIVGKTFKTPMREWCEYKNPGWQAEYAMDQLAGEYGDCISSATAFGYLCVAIGYDNVELCTATMRKEPHCWIMLDGRIFDPQQTRKFNNMERFYNADPDVNYWRASKETFTELLRQKIVLPQLDPSHILQGIKYEGGAYYYYKDNEKQRSIWKTVNGKRYYFMSNGKAATGPRKVASTYYVFSTKGVLQRGTKTRVVKVGGTYYRVTKSGKAYPGRTKTSLYLKNGERATGSCKVGKRYYVYSSKGRLLSGKTTRTIRVSGVYYQVAKSGRAKGGWNKARTRYFTANGKQVKGLRKVGSTYYVFSDAGVLKRGKSTRVVKVSGNRYLATKTGKAKTGWSSSHKYLFAGHGKQVKGSCFYKGKLYYLSPTSGAYSSSKTSTLRSLAVKGGSASGLKELLGTPKKIYQAESCLGYQDRDGDDVVYTYENLRVQTFLVTQPDVEDTGVEYLLSVTAR